tara:strand:+ start:27359 stop:27733 length:375 start_codon:yes stop_codon:yes gene_type:complete
MKKTYQLSKSGLERMDLFRRDILSGNVTVSPEYYEDGEICYFKASNKDTATCSFTTKEDEVISDLLKQIESTLEGDIEKRYMSHDRSYSFFTVVDGGIALKREDITTPAQRALENIATKLNERV